MGFWKLVGRTFSHLGNQSGRMMAVIVAAILSTLAGICVGLVIMLPHPFYLVFVLMAFPTTVISLGLMLAIPTTVFVLPITALLVPARYGLRRLALLGFGSISGWATVRVLADSRLAGGNADNMLSFAAALAGLTAGAIFGHLMADTD